MKHLILILILAATQAFAGPLDEKIAQVEAEIAQREAVVNQLKAEGKPSGRFEMTVWRLRNELVKLKDLNG
jgi:hypothetical protein